jgi:hypothetical protein
MLIPCSPFSWHPPIERHSLPQFTSHWCMSPKLSKFQWTLSVPKTGKLTIMWCHMATMALRGLKLAILCTGTICGVSLLPYKYICHWGLFLTPTSICLDLQAPMMSVIVDLLISIPKLRGQLICFPDHSMVASNLCLLATVWQNVFGDQKHYLAATR